MAAEGYLLGRRGRAVAGMERFRMVFEVHFADVTADEVERWGFAVLDELVGLDGVIDADLTADLGQRRVWYDFLVDSADVTEALAMAAGAFRTALHAAGVATPGLISGWPYARADRSLIDCIRHRSSATCY